MSDYNGDPSKDPNTLGNQGRWKVFKYLMLIGSYWEAIGVLLFWDKPRIK